MSSSTPSRLPTTSTEPPDSLQLEVLETSDTDIDDLPIDEELVLATDELDNDDMDVRQQKRPSRFSLPRINLGRKSKGKYSRVTAEHITSTAHSKSAQPVTSAATASTNSHSAYTPSFDERSKPCMTWFNVCLFLSLCLTIFLAGFIGYTIGHRSFNNTSHSIAGTKTIILSLDGFAANYLTVHAALLPNITAIAAAGLSALPLTPGFPSSTFPNHYTLITGLYPTEHGIVANRMYNESSNEWFVVGPTLTDESYWWLGEPVWSTAQQHGLRSAVLNWPGSDKVIGGRRPDVWSRYNGDISNADRVTQLMTWLDTGACTLCMVYFSSVDSVGHEFGPQSATMQVALAEMDGTVGSVVAGLKQRGLWDSVNLMIVSDHGMTSVNGTNSPDNNKLVLIDHFTDITDYVLVFSGAIAHILPTNNATAAQLYSDLSSIHNTHNCSTYYAKNNSIPLQYHYNFSDSVRIQPIVVICELGVIVMNSSYVDEALKGAHGYIGSEQEMGAILLLHGVGVSEAGVNVSMTGVKSVDVYGLMCWLLGIKAARNEGNIQQFLPYLNYTYHFL